MSQPWLDLCAAELHRQGVPRRLAAQLLAELRDHWEDSLEEGPMSSEAMAARMGEPGEVAATASAEWRKTRRRRAGVWLAASALPIFVAGAALALLPLFAANWIPGLDEWVERDLATSNLVCEGLAWWFRVAPWAAASAALAWWGVRSEVSRAWQAAAFGQLALLALLLGVVTRPKSPTELGSIMVQAGFPPTFDALRLPAALLVAGIAAWTWRRRSADVPVTAS